MVEAPDFWDWVLSIVVLILGIFNVGVAIYVTNLSKVVNEHVILTVQAIHDQAKKDGTL